MKKSILLTIMVGVVNAQGAFAGEVPDTLPVEPDMVERKSSSIDLSLAEYIAKPIECIVMELATQYESGVDESSFHCEEIPLDPDTMDGTVFELEGLPPGFEQTCCSTFSSGRAKLRASKLYRSQYKLIFTEETIWSISEY
jgi:hypothetical protein